MRENVGITVQDNNNNSIHLLGPYFVRIIEMMNLYFLIESKE